MGNILVFAECKGGKFRKSSLEAISAAAGIARSLGGKVEALALGSGLPAGEAEGLGKCGATSVTLVDDAVLASFSGDGWASVIARIAKERAPAAVLFSATSQGKDLAPRVAAALGVGLASDCTELLAEGGKIRARRPIYAGKAYATLETDASPFMATLRPNVFAVESGGGNAIVAKAAAGISAADCKAVVKEFLAATGGKFDVAESSIVVSGGRGMQAADKWGAIEELAAALGAATGASRAVVDAGWRPHGEQVGQTGKTVAPVLYIAAGISGAIQHLAGMRTSKVIVAINKDAEAPIFKVADYGIVGDALEVLPALTKAVKELKAKEH